MGDIFDTRSDAELEDDDDFDEDEDESGEEGYDGDNPIIDRDEERAVNDERNAGGPQRPPQKRQLLGVFDERGNLMVMYAINGRPIEQPRPPTKAEYDEVKARGYIVKGGLAAVAPDVVGGFPWMPVLIGAAVLAAGAGAYYYVTGKEDEAEENTVYVNPSDDDEDEDDGEDD